MTDYPPTHLLRVHVPDPEPDEDGVVRAYLPTTGFFICYAPAADLTSIPPEDLLEFRFPVGSVWRLHNGAKAQITDTRQDTYGHLGCRWEYTDGRTNQGSVGLDRLRTAERVR